MENSNLDELKKMLTPKKSNVDTAIGCVLILVGIVAFAACAGAFYGIAIRVARWVSGT